MKEKKFNKTVEKIFSSLSDEEKAEYLNKENNYWNKVRHVSIVLLIISSIATIIATIVAIPFFVTTKDTGCWCGTGISALFVMIGLVLFIESVNCLKSSDNTKVKDCIQRLKNQKAFGEQEGQKRIEKELNKNVHYRLQTERIKSVTILDSYTEISDKLHAVLNYQEIIQTRMYKFNVVYNDGSSKVITAAENSEEYAVLMPLVGEKPTGTATQTSSDNIELLREYKKLLDEGVITQEEFDAKKKKLLN